MQRWWIAVALLLVATGARPSLAKLTSEAAARAAGEALATRVAGGVRIAYSRATGVARFVRLPPRSEADLSPTATGTSDARCRAFLSANRALFGLQDSASELVLLNEQVDRADPLGYRHLTYRQLDQGVPVFAALLRAHFDAAGRLRAVQGTIIPDLALDTRPRVGAEMAWARARSFFTAQLDPAGGAPIGAAPTLVVYRSGLERPTLGIARLAWSVEVADGGRARARIFVDARTGKVLDWLPEIYDAEYRRAYSGIDQAPFDGIPDSFPQSPDWMEGEPFPTGTAELDAALAATDDTYRFYAALGRDSYDGAGHRLDVSWNAASFCPNASWNGVVATFCQGFAAHDVVAHEWSHAYTAATSGLIYRWQSGALDESFSDVWGESLDQKTKLSAGRDTDQPANRRTDGACSRFEPARLRVIQPASVAGDFAVGQAAFGKPAASAPPADLVRVEDTGGADPHDACEPLTDDRVAGRIAFADRGTCDFESQARHVQAAGAIGLVVGNLASSPSPDVAPAMGCDPVTACDLAITLSAVSLNRADADELRAALSGGVKAAILSGHNAGADDSVRWLLGEDVRPLGVARDMWNPECRAAPGKTSDPDYWCANADSGGVHVNSGVPNHAFALLVDGGSYNGASVAGIGLVKAAWIYWRAERDYETPATDFSTHADALETACDDLVGTPLADPWGGHDVALSTDDCAQVAAANAAVEMRADPPCDFIHLLAPDPPPICGDDAVYPVAESTFDEGADGWTVSRRAVASPTTFDPRDWTRVTNLPDRRPGFAFFAPDPKSGDCVTGQHGDDESGVLVLESPDLVLPAGRPARLAFDHDLATEPNWDGGNLKLSVGGGPWILVPAAAFRFNAYTGPLFLAPDNTDPLAGEPAFHGTDQGSNSGSWGTSIIDLAGLVAPGQRFRVRFELGSDVCSGSTLGWWVDDVRLVACTDPGPIFLDGFESGNLWRWSAAVP